MSLPTLLSLLAYLSALAMTQTVYGNALLVHRWSTLLCFLGTGCADWILLRFRKESPWPDGTSGLLTVYLLATVCSVVFAENWVFSGMRWASHAVMLIVFLVFLRNTIRLGQVQLVLGALKTIVAGLLLVSWWKPAPMNALDNPYFYRGAMGNANSLGHIAVIASLLFFHGSYVSVKPAHRHLQRVMAVLAMITTWDSGARSSMVALTFGLLVMSYYYRRRMRRFVLGSVIALGLAAFIFPQLPREVSRFVVKRADPGSGFTEQALKTRRPLWQASWEAFKERPIFGWGFGADSKVPSEWQVKLTSLGTIERDAVNDIFFMMEGSGIAGILAYLILLYLAARQRPTARQRRLLERFTAPPALEDPGYSLLHSHVLFFTLGSSLLVLNQFDGSALSAGNFASAIIWLCVGTSGALLLVAESAEVRLRNHRHLIRTSVEIPGIEPAL